MKKSKEKNQLAIKNPIAYIYFESMVYYYG